MAGHASEQVLPGLSAAPSWLLCDILFPDGRTTTVRSSCPVGAEGYVHAAVQFKSWASKPKALRVREAEHHVIEQEKIGVELHRIRRYLVTAETEEAIGASAPPHGSFAPPLPLGTREAREDAAASALRAAKREEERLAAIWLGGKAQVASELLKIERLLGAAPARANFGEAADSEAAASAAHKPGPAAEACPALEGMAGAAARPLAAGSAKDEVARIERFLQQVC